MTIAFLITLGTVCIVLSLLKIFGFSWTTSSRVERSQFIVNVLSHCLSVLGMAVSGPQFSVFVVLGAFFCLMDLLSAMAKSKIERSKPKIGFCLRTLNRFKWFCRGEARSIVELTVSDLKRDIRAMKKEGRSRWFIRLAVFWQTMGTIMPILWDGVRRISASLGPIARWLSLK